MRYDVVIVGGGPAGLAAALTLGRARKRVLLCDGGPRRNAAATHVHNFVTRDGTPPEEMRRIGRAQLAPYPSVEIWDHRVDAIRGARDAFVVRTGTGEVEARRVLLATGMIDEPPPIAGMRELWGTSIFVCPYCHAWEVRDRRFGYLAASADALAFALLLRGWTRDVVAFTNARFAVPLDEQARFARAGVRIEERPIERLVGDAGQLTAVALADGDAVAQDVLFAHPPQRQVDVVRDLGLALDPAGYVIVDEVQRETSVPGVYAGGDLISPFQSAVLAAAAGARAAGALNHALTIDLATAGELP